MDEDPNDVLGAGGRIELDASAKDVIHPSGEIGEAERSHGRVALADLGRSRGPAPLG